MNKVVVVSALAATALALAACGTSPAARPAPQLVTVSPDGATQEVIGGAMVLEDTKEGTGPQLCINVAQSYPPQCGGPRITNWSWDEFEGEESANGVKWTDAVILRGRFAGSEFTMTAPASAAQDSFEAEPVDEDDTFKTPCQTPSGGWQPTDASKWTRDHVDVALNASHPDRGAPPEDSPGRTYGKPVPGYAGSLITHLDKQGLPTKVDPYEADKRAADNDGVTIAERILLTVWVTGDQDKARTLIQRTWGGPLCMAHGRFDTEAQNAMQEHVWDVFDKLPGFEHIGLTGSSTDENGIEVDVLYDDGRAKKYLEDKYGKGSARINAAFLPAKQSTGDAAGSSATTSKQP